jgi:hypothetical protein
LLEKDDRFVARDGGFLEEDGNFVHANALVRRKAGVVP